MQMNIVMKMCSTHIKVMTMAKRWEGAFGESGEWGEARGKKRRKSRRLQLVSSPVSAKEGRYQLA